MVRFGLCEIDRVLDRYIPSLLGVEIYDVPSGGLASPVLGVANPPGMFRSHTILSMDIAEPSAPSGTGWTANAPLPPVLLPPSEIERRLEARDADKPPAETPAQRRERLQRAPFIE